MVSFKNSITTRLALGYGLLMVVTVMVASAVFYFGTVGVLDRSIDSKISLISSRLIDSYRDRPVEELLTEINRELTDGIDSDTEIFLVVNEKRERVAGNLAAIPVDATFFDHLVTMPVVRFGKQTKARIIVRQLPGGAMLVVGRDLAEQAQIRDLVLRALGIGAVISMFLAVAGAAIFRQQLQRRIGDIRHTAESIEGGNLSRRIPVSGDDEFSLLSLDINRMLDRIEHLMDGVRQVSNAIAHDLRTPLSRIRSSLDQSLRTAQSRRDLSEAAATAIESIDDLVHLFDKLLQIAEAESGMRTESFDAVDLAGIARDMVELYDAAAEENGVALRWVDQGAVPASGDHNLLASAVASLIDNAIKYAGPGATIEVGAYRDGKLVSLVVRDNGPGVPEEELPKLTVRFYRLDRSRSLPGNGLGLSIVSAIAAVHGGELRLESAHRGLVCRIVLPGGPNLSKP